MKKSLNLFEHFCLTMIILITASTWMLANPQYAIQINNDSEINIEEQIIYIHAPSGLKLRTAPGLHSETLGVIHYGDQVKIITERNAENSFDNKYGWFKGSWIKVDHNGVVGYVFDAYTSTLPIPLMDIESLDCADPAQALMTYINDEFDIKSGLDTLLNRSTDYNVHIKIGQELKNGAKGIYRQFDNGYSTEFHVPDARVLDGYNLMSGIFAECDQLSELTDDAIFIKERGTEEIKEVRADGLKIKKLADGGISIKCTYIYQATCCYVE